MLPVVIHLSLSLSLSLSITCFIAYVHGHQLWHIEEPMGLKAGRQAGGRVVKGRVGSLRLPIGVRL